MLLPDPDVRGEERGLTTIIPCQIIAIRPANPGRRDDRKQPRSQMRTKVTQTCMVREMRNNAWVEGYLASSMLSMSTMCYLKFIAPGARLICRMGKTWLIPAKLSARPMCSMAPSMCIWPFLEIEMNIQQAFRSHPAIWNLSCRLPSLYFPTYCTNLQPPRLHSRWFSPIFQFTKRLK